MLARRKLRGWVCYSSKWVHSMVRRGRRSQVGRDNIEVAAVNYACRAGYYDTNSYYHISNGLEREPFVTLKRVRWFLPKGATHRFFIQVEKMCYLVTRYSDNWIVEFDDRTEEQQRERCLRYGALSKALHHFAHRMSDTLDDGEYVYIKQLLNEGLHLHLRNVALSGHHPIVRDEPPHGEMRCWSVMVGAYSCLVGLAKDTPEPEFAILPS